jgi:hypothetical protein
LLPFDANSFLESQPMTEHPKNWTGKNKIKNGWDF